VAQSRAKRNYRKEYANYQGRPEQIANRSNRNKARRKMANAGLVKKGDGKDVDHKRPIVKGGGNTRANLRIAARRNNRSFPRTRKARMQ
jgi:5-methylcytosine-specific restriction endonuclease McrA